MRESRVLEQRVFGHVQRERRLDRGSFAVSDFHVNVAIAHFAFKDLCALALTPAGSILQADVPTMPTADHFAALHDAFAQGKTKVRTEILDGVNTIVPTEQSDIQTGNLDRMTEAF
jgi:hypothetical protein